MTTKSKRVIAGEHRATILALLNRTGVPMTARRIGETLDAKYWLARVGKSNNSATRIDQFLYRMKKSKLLRLTTEGYEPAQGAKLNGAFKEAPHAPYRIDVNVRLIIGGRSNSLPLTEIPRLHRELTELMTALRLPPSEPTE
jgi:hypothetical protein